MSELGAFKISLTDFQAIAQLHAEGKTVCEIVRIVYLPTRHVRYAVAMIEAAGLELQWDRDAAAAEADAQQRGKAP